MFPATGQPLLAFDFPVGTNELPRPTSTALQADVGDLVVAILVQYVAIKVPAAALTGMDEKLRVVLSGYGHIAALSTG